MDGQSPERARSKRVLEQSNSPVRSSSPQTRAQSPLGETPPPGWEPVAVARKKMSSGHSPQREDRSRSPDGRWADDGGIAEGGRLWDGGGARAGGGRGGSGRSSGLGSGMPGRGSGMYGSGGGGGGVPFPDVEEDYAEDYGEGGVWDSPMGGPAEGGAPLTPGFFGGAWERPDGGVA